METLEICGIKVPDRLLLAATWHCPGIAPCVRGAEYLGLKFNRLWIIGKASRADHIEHRDKDKSATWVCRCECGRYCKQKLTSLRTGSAAECAICVFRREAEMGILRACTGCGYPTTIPPFCKKCSNSADLAQQPTDPEKPTVSC